MTVPELTANVLDNLKRNFYTVDGTLRIREFKRDELQLIRAIATYGHECNQRNWQFDADFIYQDLMKLLLAIRTSGAEIKYLPVYLEGAIRRHIGLRAEELSARAKSLSTKISNVVARDLKPCKVVDAVRVPTTVEVFSEMFRGIKQIQRGRKHGKKAAAKETQEQLL